MTPCVFYVVRKSESKLPLDDLDKAEKISRERPEVLAPHKTKLIRLAGAAKEANARWHLAQILPRLPLTARERAGVSEILFEYLNDRSALVKTFSMQGLTDLARVDARLMPTVLPVIEHLTVHGTAAMRARGRKLLKSLSANQAI